MLEGLAAWVLNTYLGEYVENLNTDQLSIGILNGNVELENLPLRKDALRALDLPIEVKAGFIGKLQLQIPMRRVKSEAWVIRISQLYLVAGPPVNATYHEEHEKQAYQMRKQAELKSLEEKWKAGRQVKSTGFWSTLTSSFASSISENLQLIIDDVHFRYEDSTVDLSHPVAIGVTIKKLAVQSADEKWLPNFVTGASMMRKLVELEQVAVYWDVDAALVGDVPVMQLKDALNRTMLRKGSTVGFSKHDFVVEPVSARVRLIRDYSPKPLRSADKPRFRVEFELEEIPICLSDHQYRGALKLVEAFDFHSRKKRYRKQRPLVPLHSNAGLYWQFAIYTILEPIQKRNRRKTRDFCLERARNNVLYVKKYGQQLAKGVNDSVDQATIDKIELEHSVEEIIILRGIVYDRIKREDDLAKAQANDNGQTQGLLQRWFPGWTGWGASTPQEETPVDNQDDDTVIPFEDELGSLETSEADQSIFKRDSVFARLLCNLKGGYLKLKGSNLLSDENESSGEDMFAELCFSELKLSVETRLRTNSLSVDLSLHSIHVYDRVTKDSLFPEVIRPQRKELMDFKGQERFQRLYTVDETGDGQEFFHLTYEQNPSHSNSDYRLAVSALPLYLVYNKMLIDRVKTFFSPSDTSTEAAFHRLAKRRYEELKTQTKAELRQTFDEWTHAEVKETKRWDIGLSIDAPHVIVPESFTDRSQPMVVLDLGHFSFGNSVPPSLVAITAPKNADVFEEVVDSDDDVSFETPPSTPPSEADHPDGAPLPNTLETLESAGTVLLSKQKNQELYNRYTLEAADLQILVGSMGSEWKQAHLKGMSPLHVVDKFTISLQLERRLSFSTDPAHPNATAYGNLPNLVVHVDEAKIQAMTNCLKSISQSSVGDHSAEIISQETAMDTKDGAGVPGKGSYTSLMDATGWHGGSTSDYEENFYSILPAALSQSFRQPQSHESSAMKSEQNRPVSISDETMIESRLLVAGFAIGEVNLGLNSRGRPICELRIPGLHVNVVQRPYNTRVLAVVQDLLMVDALQKFGGEYELLISSCPDLEPTQLSSLVISPVESPQSPVPPDINSPDSNMPEVQSSDDALFSLVFNRVSALCPDDVVLPGKGARQVVSLSVKTLDIIANQETMVELMGFFNRAFPNQVKDEGSPASDGSDLPDSPEYEAVGETWAVQTDIAAEFHCLNLLLVRDENRVGSQSFGPPVGRKVSSICLSELCLHASLGRRIEVTGSVEGVAVLDQTQQGWLHREIFKIGVVPGRELKITSEDDEDECPQRAFSFELTKQTDKSQSVEKVTVEAKLAALHYLHTRTFLNELQLCVSDFRHFTLELATSLRTAAAGMAMGIVGQKEILKGGVDYLSKSFAGDSVDETDGQFAEDTFDGIGEVEVSTKVYLHIDIGSPVVLLPRASDSGEMFIAHLGHITASNSFVTEDPKAGEMDRLAVTVKDMHLFSCEINTTEWQQKSSMESSLSNSVKQQEILHDTTLELEIKRATGPAIPLADHPSPLSDQSETDFSPSVSPLSVSGKVTTPLKVTLSKPVFKQALATLDFVTDDKAKDEINRPTVTSEGGQDDIASTVNDHESDFHPIVGSFTIPKVSVILRGVVASNQADILTDERDIVEVSLEQFSLRAQKQERFITQLQVKLRGLLVDDLIHSRDTNLHHILSSYVAPGYGIGVPSTVFAPMHRPFGVLSLSQPIIKQPLDVFQSLPAASSSPLRKPLGFGSSLRSGHMLVSPIGKPQKDKDGMLEYWKELDLVNVKVLLVDRSSPKFATEYESVSRFVDVDFNVLSAVVNLQTWVILLDFFGIGVPDQPNVSVPPAAEKPSSMEASPQPTVAPVAPEKPNMNVKVQVNALTLTLNKSQYPLAEASVSGLAATVLSRKEKNCVSGRLEFLCLSDISPNGNIYSERLCTSGNKEIVFDLVKYSVPDWELHREFDVSVMLNVPTVRYIHTQHFLQETVAFCQHFVQIMDAYQRMKAAAADILDYRGPTRSPRVLLDIEADSPLITVPRSAASPDMLVIDLGHLRATNRFQFSGTEGTIRGKLLSTQTSAVVTQSVKEDERREPSSFSVVGSDLPSSYGVSQSMTEPLQSPDAEKERHFWQSAQFTGPCLLDCIDLSLSDMDVFTAKRERGQDEVRKSNKSTIGRNRGPMLADKCKFNLKIERNLCNDLSKAVPEFLIAGELSSVHILVDQFQLALIKDMLDHNLGEPLEEFERPESVIRDPVIPPIFDGVWTVIDLTIALVNVTVELVLRRSSSLADSRLPLHSLAKFELEESKFCVTTQSNKSKTANLMSTTLRAFDIRQHGGTEDVVSNVFTEVLSPVEHNTAESPQLEISYYMADQRNRLAVVLHRARLVVLLDWLLQAKEFLLTKPEDLKQEDSENEDTDEVDFHHPTPSPVAQFQIPQKESKPLDINLSVTDTDFVVVEDVTDLHSNAVILKWTLVLTSKESDCGERSLGMSLSDMELFSCQLGSEEETALSIIDPASMSVSLEPQSLLSKSQMSKSSSHTDSTVLPTLEIVAQTGANIRLSYRDIELFLAILSTLRRQLQGQSLLSLSSNETEIESNSGSEGSDNESSPVNSVLLSRLKGLGYPESLCDRALRETGGDLSRAADWLVDNAPEMKEEESKPTARKMPAGSVDVRCPSLRVTVIDDCGDSDVPLVEVSVTNLAARHDILQVKPGMLRGTIQGEYYNGNLGAWEPFLEPWSCLMTWSQVPNGRSSRRLLTVKADKTDGNDKRLELNLTSMLLETLKRTKSRWSEEYSKFSQQARPHQQRRGRARFVPFILRNNAGCHLQFATSVLVPSKVSHDEDSEVLTLAVASLRSATARRASIKQSMGSVSTSPWTPVAPGEECPFGYETHKKRRHHRSSTPRLYQLEVELDGWRAISPPVSVDKVGVFFRYIEPQKDGDVAAEPFTVRDKRPVRVVFAISVVGATKVINVRSGLVVHNKMDIPVELCVEHPGPQTAAKVAIHRDTLTPIRPGTKSAIPLHLTLWNLRARPFGWGSQFSESTIEWKRVRVCRQQTLHRCIPIGQKGPTFKFCTTVQRDGYPQTRAVEPGHTITIQPPVTVYNLLPVDMTVCVLMSGAKALHSVKPGKRASLYEVDPGNGLNFGVLLDGFPHCEDVFVPLARDYILRLCVYDSEKRPLWLYAKTEVSGKALKVYVLCPFWLENCTGLPLVFKNDHAQMEAAGQHEEHERARSVSPLLFSYSLPDLPNKCCVRIGNYSPTLRGKPLWSKRFRLEKADGDFIQVHVSQGHNKPNIIHEIGYTIRRGKGLYVDTMIVKFVTRFLLFNNSSHRLAYGQKYETHETGTMPVIALPNSMMTYNWSRVDLDQLMCIRIQDIPDCHWSGGFKLSQDHSFHVIMRGALDRSYFIRVQVSLKDATYHVVFSDATHVPPPFRIENLSQVPVVFYQRRIVDTSLRRELKPQQSVPYAWDEPTLLKSLVLAVTDGPQQQVYNIDQMGEKEPLMYENYIYIAAECSVPLSGQSRVLGAMQRHLTQSAGPELVLDVPQGSAVLFKRRETNRPSQLWRMTAAGQLEHMGSVLTRRSERKTPMVLDITDESQRCITLMIRRLDKGRASTQTWKYDGDKRLSCGMPRMFVQPRGGIRLLADGSDAVLAPDSYINGGQSVPPEQVLRIMKQKEGSGTLCVRVTPDGPTRVVRIVDKMARPTASSQQLTNLRRLRSRLSRSSSVDSTMQNMYETSVDQEPDSVGNDFQVILSLSSGVGLSVINSVPEELCYVTLSGLEVNFLETCASQSLDVTVQQIQADNQLIGAQTSALLYRTKQNSNRSELKDSPTCSVSVKRCPSHHAGVEVLTKLMVTVKPITLQLDERLLLSLLQFGGFKVDDDSEPGQELLQLTDQLHGAFSRPKSAAKLYYIDTLTLNEMDLKLSMLTSKLLSEDLLAVKRRLPIMLVKFENANIILDAYTRRHLCDSLRVHIDKIRTHYEKQFKGQAASIIGSVDFLGNPFGLLNDVTSGVSGVMTSGDLPGLVARVAHGVTDSASKLTGTASNVLEKVTMDERYEARRAKISEGAKSSGDHLMAGVKGLAHGFWGGLTSIVSRTYEGATQEGIGGIVTGLAKGVAGTVTKPAVGVLDFASGAAAAVSAGTTTQPRQPDPVRPRRYCVGIGGVLPQYSSMLAKGWDILLRLNDGNRNERLIAYEGLQYGRTKMCVIISSYQLCFFGSTVPTDHDDVTIHVKLAEIQRCDPISKQSSAGKGLVHYMQLVVEEAERGVRTKLIRCDTEKISRKVAQEINYAKSLHDEQKHMVDIPAGHSAEIW